MQRSPNRNPYLVHISATYVRHILRNIYRYDVLTKHGVKVHSHFQPQVKEIGRNAFLITAPYHNVVQKKISLILMFFNNEWFLVLKTNRQVTKLFKENYRFRKYIRFLLIKYQIGISPQHRFFIPLIDYSLQNAYYRLVHFTLAYNAVAEYLLG